MSSPCSSAASLTATVLDEEAARLAAQALLHSSAIGLRYYEAPRLLLERETRRVDTRFGRITVKWVTAPDGRRVAAPEYESCARAARRAGAPLREVYRAAERAAEDADL